MAFDEATKMYKEVTKRSFHKFVEAYEVLKHAPKFKIVPAGRPGTISHVLEQNQNEHDPFQPQQRPLGNKRAKKNHNNEAEEKRVARLEEITAAAKAMAKASEERNRLNEDKIAFIFFQDDPDSEEAKEFKKMKRQEYLQRLKNRAAIDGAIEK